MYDKFKSKKKKNNRNLIYHFSFWLEEITTIFAIVIFSIMVVSVLLGIFYRYILLNPLLWSDELAVYCMIWVGYLGVGIALKYDEHPYLEFVITKLPLTIKVIMQWITNFGVFLFLLVVMFWGFRYAFFSGGFRSSSGLGIKMTAPMLSVPIGFFLAIVHMILKILGSNKKIVLKKLKDS